MACPATNLIKRRGAMSRKKVWIGILVVILLGEGLLPVWSAEVKIGLVDIQRAINESQAGKDAKKALAKEAEKFQKQLQDKQRELQTLKESFEKQSMMLSQEAKVNKEKEYQTKLRDFQRWGQDSQNDLNAKRAEMERHISLGLQKVIKKVGEEDGYTIVLERNEAIVLYGSKTNDITDRVIKAFDAQKK
jgi:outer membrane protein